MYTKFLFFLIYIINIMSIYSHELIKNEIKYKNKRYNEKRN